MWQRCIDSAANIRRAANHVTAHSVLSTGAIVHVTTLLRRHDPTGATAAFVPSRVPAAATAAFAVQVDLYAVGAIAYEFIYGRPPFYRRDRAEKKALILKGKLVFTSAFSVQAQVRYCCSCGASLHCARCWLLQTPCMCGGSPPVCASTITSVDTGSWCVQHFIQKAMHYNPACRGSATDLLSHQWILHHTGQELTPHWAQPEAALAHSQIPGPPHKPAASSPDPPSRMHQYKFGSALSNSAAMAATSLVEDEGLPRTATWDASLMGRSDTKHRLDHQVSALKTTRRPAAAEGGSEEGAVQSGMVRPAALLCVLHQGSCIRCLRTVFTTMLLRSLYTYFGIA